MVKFQIHIETNVGMIYIDILFTYVPWWVKLVPF
jgi:hypothetical protein